MGYTHFSKTERVELAVLLEKGYSIRDIASGLGRNPSSVSRELRRGNVKGRYDPRKAQQKARVRRLYSKYQGMKIRERPGLERYVQDRLAREWTPEQIAGRLREAHDGKTVVTAKTIYKWLFSVWGQPWCRYLPSRRYRRKKRKGKKRKKSIPNRKFLAERPIGAAERTEVGHFEADTLGVPKGTRETVAGAVDRKSLYFVARRIERLGEAVEGYQEILPEDTRSVTLDNGFEHVRHEEIGVPTYFASPYRSWEKPVIENTFQRLRRWIPKGSGVRAYTDEDIVAIVDRMNDTPRKRLNYRTPREVFEGRSLTFNHRECCASG